MYTGHPSLPLIPNLVLLVIYVALAAAVAAMMPMLLRRSRLWALPYLLFCLYGLGQCGGGIREALSLRQSYLTNEAQYHTSAEDVAWHRKQWLGEAAGGVLYGTAAGAGMAWLLLSLWRPDRRRSEPLRPRPRKSAA